MNKNKSGFKKIVFFPERMSNVAIMVLVVLMIAVGITVSAVAFPERKYQYIPSYDEPTYAEKSCVSLYVKSVYSFDSTNTAKLVKKDTVNIIVNSVNSSAYSVTNKNVSVIGLTKNDNMFYYSSKTNSQTYYVTSSSTIEGDGFKELSCRVDSKINVKEENENYEEDRTVKFTQKLFELSKKEIRRDNCDDFSQVVNAHIFSEHSISIKTNSSNTSQYDIVFNCSLTTEAKKDYLFEYQLFGIDEDGNVYEFVGYYGVSSVSKLFSYNETFPKSKKLRYIIAKAVYSDANKTTHNFFYKQPVADLLK